jgi:hypothetical protein
MVKGTKVTTPKVKKSEQGEEKEKKTRLRKEKKTKGKESEEDIKPENLKEIENLAGESSDDGSEDELAPIKNTDLNVESDEEEIVQTNQKNIESPTNPNILGRNRSRIEVDPNVPIKDLSTQQIVQYLINRGNEQANLILKNESINLFRTITGQVPVRYNSFNHNQNQNQGYNPNPNQGYNPNRPDYRNRRINNLPEPQFPSNLPPQGIRPDDRNNNRGARYNNNSYRNNRPFVPNNFPNETLKEDPNKGGLYE